MHPQSRPTATIWVARSPEALHRARDRVRGGAECFPSHRRGRDEASSPHRNVRSRRHRLDASVSARLPSRDGRSRYRLAARRSLPRRARSLCTGRPRDAGRELGGRSPRRHRASNSSFRESRGNSCPALEGERKRTAWVASLGRVGGFTPTSASRTLPSWTCLNWNELNSQFRGGVRPCANWPDSHGARTFRGPEIPQGGCQLDRQEDSSSCRSSQPARGHDHARRFRMRRTRLPCSLLTGPSDAHKAALRRGGVFGSWISSQVPSVLDRAESDPGCGAVA